MEKSLDKYIEIVKEFIKKDYEPWSFYEKQGDELFELQEAIKLVLWYMNDYKNENEVLHKELETYKKIAEFLAKKIVGVIQYDYIYENICSNNPNYVFCENIGNHIKCKQCLLDNARKEVEKDVKN